jgi:hypothetical protein
MWETEATTSTKWPQVLAKGDFSKWMCGTDVLDIISGAASRVPNNFKTI